MDTYWNGTIKKDVMFLNYFLHWLEFQIVIKFKPVRKLKTSEKKQHKTLVYVVIPSLKKAVK